MGRGRQPNRAKILMSTGRPHHFGHLFKLKESLQALTLYTSFHNLINVYSRRSEADNPREQNFDVNRNLLSLRPFATSFIKSLWSLILYIFVHDFKHVYSPGAGADNPLGTRFWYQQEHLFTSVICWPYHFTHFLQVSKKSLWSLILCNFFHD